MLCVISGFSSPACVSLAARRSRSSASGARLKSFVLTSWSSSSTPIVNACECLNSTGSMSVARFLLTFAGRDQRVTCRDRSDDVENRNARGDDGCKTRSEIRCDVVDRLSHADRKTRHRRQRERKRGRLRYRDSRRPRKQIERNGLAEEPDEHERESDPCNLT